MTLLQSLHNLYPMNIASLSFVFVYLPVSLFAYYIAPRSFKPTVLLIVSLIFFTLSQPMHLPLMLISLVVDFALARSITALGESKLKKLPFAACVVKNILIIGYFGVSSTAKGTPIPFGLFVYALSGIDGAFETYREKDARPVEFIPYALYIAFFPRLYAGPLLPASDFCAKLEQPDTAGIDSQEILLSFGRFSQGLFKYAVLGRDLFLLHNSVRAIPAESVTLLSSWLFPMSFALSLYYTLSGLADIARGIAGLFGIPLPQNFYYPYQSRSITDFFDRFNITVGAFLKRTVLAVLDTDKDDPVADSLNLLLVGMLWGLWFGIRAGYMACGAFIALFMIMERFIYPKLLRTAPTLFCRGYALCAALLGFSVLAGETLMQGFNNLARMFGLGIDSILPYNDRVLYVLTSNRTLLVFSCLLATNAVSLFVSFVRKSYPRASSSMFFAADVGIMALFTAIKLGGGAA